MKKAIVLAAALILPAFAQADAIQDLAKVKASEEACQSRAKSNQEMIGCEVTAYAAADAVLNKQYKAMVAELNIAGDAETQKYNAETLKRLKASERAWITFRDAQCSFEGTNMLFGSGENLIVSGCLFSETAKRIESLEAVLHPEGC